MKSTTTKTLALVMALVMAFALLSLTACSNSTAPRNSTTTPPQSETPMPPSSSIVSSSPSSVSQSETAQLQSSVPTQDDDILEALKQKGLKDWQIKSLAQRGFSFEEQLEMTQEKIGALLSPGSSPSYGREFAEDEMNNLQEHNIDEEKIYILRSLGYEYDDMMQLTDEQIDFIFPNTELIDKLVQSGYEREAVEHMDALIEMGYGSYKELLDEVFSK